jgi:hypothetical protein
VEGGRALLVDGNLLVSWLDVSVFVAWTASGMMPIQVLDPSPFFREGSLRRTQCRCDNNWTTKTIIPAVPMGGISSRCICVFSLDRFGDYAYTSTRHEGNVLWTMAPRCIKGECLGVFLQVSSRDEGV